MNSIKQYLTQQKICYTWEYAYYYILADNYVSVFDSHDFFSLKSIAGTKIPYRCH